MCSLQKDVKDVFTAITFEVAYSLGKHEPGHPGGDLPALTPVLRWRKGNKIATRNEVKILTQNDVVFGTNIVKICRTSLK